MSISPAILIDRGNRVVQLEFVPNLYGTPFADSWRWRVYHRSSPLSNLLDQPLVKIMFSSSSMTRDFRDQEFAPLLFSLSTTGDGVAVTTPRTSTTPHRGRGEDSSMSTQRRATPGSVHTETTPPTPPPPVLRLVDDVIMGRGGSPDPAMQQLLMCALPPTRSDDPSSSRVAAVPPPIHSLSPARDAMQTSSYYYEPSAVPSEHQHQDIWVTVFGFSQADTPLILKVGRHPGERQERETGKQ